MLVLSRKQQQCIRIGDDVVVTVVRIGDGSVRLGVSAPRDVPVVRLDEQPREFAAQKGGQDGRSATNV